MAQREDVRRIYANPQVQMDLPVEESPVFALEAPDYIQWNIDQVNAELVWARAIPGRGW